MRDPNSVPTPTSTAPHQARCAWGIVAYCISCTSISRAVLLYADNNQQRFWKSRTIKRLCTMQPAPCCLLLCILALAATSCSKYVKHNLTLTWEVGSPNGQPREIIHMNGRFPGPEFVWDEGDDVEVCTKYGVRRPPGAKLLTYGRSGYIIECPSIPAFIGTA